MRGGGQAECAHAGGIGGGNLEGLEEEACPASGEARGADGVEHLSEGGLDAAAISEAGEFEGFVGDGGRPCGLGVEAGVVVAPGLSPEGERMALESVGPDVAAFWMHRGTSPPYPVSVRKSLHFNAIQRGHGCNQLILMEFFAEIRQQRTYGRSFSRTMHVSA